jgi:hypothetical protein
MAEVLFEDVGPNGNIQAVVEADEDVCYFYLFGAEETKFGMKSVWVRNHSPAPDTLNVEGMKAGNPPQNPKAHCRHPAGLPSLKQDQLRVVWLPEGDGAALFEGTELLAIIPPWSGYKGFHGFARDALGDGQLAWEIGDSNVLIDRFQQAESYWQKWDDNPWPAVQDSLLTNIEKAFGSHTNYYAIDGGNWPPKAIVRIPYADCVVLITLGVSLRPQPQVEMSTEQPELLRRIELGVVLPASWPDEAIKQFASYLSAQSTLPWSRYTWLGAGHTIPCDSWQNRNYDVALLQAHHPAVPNPLFEPMFGDPVNLLWFMPITATERQTAMDQGSPQLIQSLPKNRWQQV